MCPHHSDQMPQRSQVSWFTHCLMSRMYRPTLVGIALSQPQAGQLKNTVLVIVLGCHIYRIKFNTWSNKRFLLHLAPTIEAFDPALKYTKCIKYSSFIHHSSKTNFQTFIKMPLASIDTVRTKGAVPMNHILHSLWPQNALGLAVFFS